MIAGAATAVAGAMAAASGYNAALAGLALARRGRETISEQGPSRDPRILVLVPAHDEEADVERAVTSLLATDYTPTALRVVVIADNCTDATAALAREAGAEVLERVDPDRRGKGFALEWALEHLAGSDHEAVLMVDADCEVTPDLPRVLVAALRRGTEVAQADYVVTNPADSASSGLRAAGFALACTARPAGRHALGASAGLLGTGMLFARGVLERIPWTSYSLAEDAEYHLDLVEHGVRVAFASQVAVRSPMPAGAQDSEQQQERWEAGRAALAKRGWASVLAGLARRDPLRLHAGIEVVLPPQSVLAAGALGAGAAGVAARSGRTVATAAASIGLQAVSIATALKLTDAPPSTYRSLAGAPLLVARKLRILARVTSRRGPQTWQRTSRH